MYFLRLSRSVIFELAALLTMLGLHQSAYAIEGDVFRPYVNLSYTYDDNARRFSDKARAVQVTGRENMADTIMVGGVGIIIDKKISRQGILLDLNINETKYDRNSELNNTGKKFFGKWDWVLGNYWRGNLQFNHREQMVPFADFRGTGLNIVTEDSAGFDAIRRLHPRWQVRAGVKQYEVEYSSEFQRSANLKELSQELALDYLAQSGDTIGIVYRHADGDRPIRETAGALQIDNSYTEDSLKANVDWNFSAKTRLRFLGGYVERKHDELSYRDFQGWNARANAYWLATGKTTFNMGVWREANAQSFVTSSYTLNKGATAGVMWSATSKISLQGSYLYEQMEFAGETVGSIVGLNREDIRRTSSINLLYKPTLNWQVNTFLNHTTRSSTEDFFAFKSSSLGLSLRYEY